MTSSCADLDPFFDGELPKEAVASFRRHLASCERCQAVLRGRMLEEAILGGSPEQFQQPVAAAAAASPPRREVHRRRIVYAAPLLLAAAAFVIWLVGTRAAPQATPIEVSLAMEHRGDPTRGGEHQGDAEGDAVRSSVAHVGDVLRSRVRGERHRAIWVYLGVRELVIACPGEAGCGSADDSLTLELRVSAPGHYSVVGISSEQPIAVPHGTLDVMLSAVATSGAHFEIRSVDVD